MQSKQEAAVEVRTAFGNGASLDDIITLLRERGLSKTESMAILEDDLDIPHREAKLAIHQSNAWREYRRAAEELEDRLLGSDET